MMSGTAFTIPPTLLPELFSVLAERPLAAGCTLIVGPVLSSADGVGRVAFTIARRGQLLPDPELVRLALGRRGLREVVLHGTSNTDSVEVEVAGRSVDAELSELWRMNEVYGVDVERLATWMGFSINPLEPDGEQYPLGGADPGLEVPPSPPPLPSLEQRLFDSFGRPVRADRVHAALDLLAIGAPPAFIEAIQQGIAKGLSEGTIDLDLGLEYAERLPSPTVSQALAERALADLAGPRPQLATVRAVAERTGSHELVEALARHRPVSERLEEAFATDDHEGLLSCLDDPSISGDQFRRAVAVLGLRDREQEVQIRCDLDAPPPFELFVALACKSDPERHAALAAVELDDAARPGWALIREAALAQASAQTGERAPAALLDRLHGAPHKLTTFWLDRLAAAPAR